MKKLKKLILPVSVIGVLMLSSVSVFANNTQNTYSNELNENYEIDLYKLSYERQNYVLDGVNLTSYNHDIQLTSDQPKGKVHYYNNSNYPATLFVPDAKGVTNEIIIQPHSQGSINWKKTGFGNKTYTAYVTAHTGYLKGIYSLAKATSNSKFQPN